MNFPAGLHMLLHAPPERVNQYLRLPTVFLYPDGSNIDLFWDQKGGVLSDLGDSMSWVHNFRPLTEDQDLILEGEVVAIYSQVIRKGGMFQMPAREVEDLPRSVLLLAQVCIRVADMAYYAGPG